VQAPPALPAADGREKEETLDTSAEVCLSSQPEIMRTSAGIAASALSLNMIGGGGWIEGWR